jgi:hypothetical protein
LKTKILPENSTPYCVSESWVRDLTIINDRPLSAALWNLEELTGELLLDELPELQVEKAKLKDRLN